MAVPRISKGGGGAVSARRCSRSIFTASALVLLVTCLGYYSSHYDQLQLASFQKQVKEEPISSSVNDASPTVLAESQQQELHDEIMRLRSQLLTVSQELNETRLTNHQLLSAAAAAIISESSNQKTNTGENTNDSANNNDGGDTCEAAFQAAIRDQTPGLSQDSIRRSRANWGHAYRLQQFARKLTQPQEQRQPIHVVAFGGSITKAHGIEHNLSIGSSGYSELLQHWLNQHYPLAENGNQVKPEHRVHNMAQHGADICHLAKRLTPMLDFLKRSHNMQQPDMILLEFAVNDYQGQDHVDDTVSQQDVFFQGFQELALCAEVVVYKLLTTYPDTAIMFVEFRTAIVHRKTAQMLHMGVAQHYAVPVISYADAVFPEFFDLVYNHLSEDDDYSVPIGETIQPFPYGCHECHPETIIEQFRYTFFEPKGVKHCRSICDIMWNTAGNCNSTAAPPPGRQYCHPPIFSVDDVHPSAQGHAIAKDLIAHAIATAVKENCERRSAELPEIAPQVLPPVGWLGTPNALQTRSNFVLVRDAECPSEYCQTLYASNHTPGFELTNDSGGFDKVGWIASNPDGDEVLEFEIALPERPCYAVYLAILRSYWVGMGMIEVTVVDKSTGSEVSVQLDSLWEPHISVWSDNQITLDDSPACTGQCIVRVRTLPQMAGRAANNKAKILTLSVRECIAL